MSNHYTKPHNVDVRNLDSKPMSALNAKRDANHLETTTQLAAFAFKYGVEVVTDMDRFVWRKFG